MHTARAKNYFHFLVIVAAIQLLPSITNRFQVRTVKAGLFVKVSKSSPPLAALNDAKLWGKTRGPTAAGASSHDAWMKL